MKKIKDDATIRAFALAGGDIFEIPVDGPPPTIETLQCSERIKVMSHAIFYVAVGDNLKPLEIVFLKSRYGSPIPIELPDESNGVVS